MKIPSPEQAQVYIDEAKTLNPGPWIEHSFYVGQAAKRIAQHHPELDPDAAFVLGYLHDIGRREGVTDMRHMLDGYSFLKTQGFDDAARICMTHSYPIKNVNAVAGKWDCSKEEFKFVEGFLAETEFDDYDRLIQLCDAIAMPSGFTLFEKRVMDVAMRHGVNEYSVARWKAYLNIQQDFEKVIGRSIYELLPGVVENTFGFDPC